MSKGSRAHYNIGFFTTGVELEYSHMLIQTVMKVAVEYNVNLISFLGGSLNPDFTLDHSKYQYQYNVAFDYAHAENLDGIILVSGVLSSFLTPTEFSHFYSKYSPLPMVSLGTYIKSLPSVYTDNKEAFKTIVSHLIKSHNRKRIAFITGPSSNRDALDRYAGYIDALTENGLNFQPELIHIGDFTPQSAIDAVEVFLDKRHLDIDAIVCANDSMALAALNELERRQIKVPQQISLTGFDNISSSMYAVPSLTSIQQPYEAFAKEAFHILFDLIHTQPANNKLIPSQLVLRDSCGQHINSPEEELNALTNLHYFFNTRLKYAGKQMDRSQSNFSSIRQILLRMTSTIFDKKAQLEALIPDLISCGIHSCMVYLYPTEIPHHLNVKWQMPSTVYLYMGYVNKEPLTLNLDPIPVSPMQITTYGFAGRETPYAISVHPIFFSNEQLGVIVLELAPENYYLIETLTIEIGCAIKLSSIFASQKCIEKKLETLSQTNELTGLLNRRGFFNSAEEKYKLFKKQHLKGILFFADMDGLKMINDTYGHHEGDFAISSMANILRETFSSEDIISRMGGDEFTIFCINKDSSFIESVSAHIQNLCNNFNNSSHKPYELSISIGALPFTSDENATLESLLSRADKLLYSQKQIRKKRKLEKQE
ncbi:hypothetical protein CS063_05945 [Sporanaerobium hydrogeniformans]|uniref:Uncharacterized protein n=1 Tax=Sporanaerobium hydrogeniformans TaxID=3072179 RepID=A0AC61DEV3_9FIRM|nr:GGDEF domain-containing protein [Sporanaerobium hydrogeniformans]PHV71231.1 hypothetical protein CS063_05945 [Sporanaerobium hydrogeniformans]